MANKAPGVYLSEVSYSASVASKNVNVTVILGTATKGPIDPTVVYSQKHAEELYGPELKTDFGLTALFKIAEEAESVVYCRVVSNGAKAKYQFNGTDIFIAKEGGTHLNNYELSAEVDESNLTLTLTLADPTANVVRESIICSLDPLAEDYITYVFDTNCELLNLAPDVEIDFSSLTGKLTLVPGEKGAAVPKAEFNQDNDKLIVEGTTFGTFLNGATFKVYTTVDKKWGAILSKNSVLIENIPLGKAGESIEDFRIRANQISGHVNIKELKLTKSAIVTLTGGNAGLDVDDEDYIDALKKFADPAQTDVTTLIIPGVSAPAVLNHAQQLASARQDFLFIADPPMGLRSYQTVN